MTFPDLLRAIGYDPRPYAHRAFERCWAIEARGLTLGILAAAILDYEADTRLDPDTRAMAIRALRSARQDSLGLDVVLYFPTEIAERASVASDPDADLVASLRLATAKSNALLARLEADRAVRAARGDR